MTVGPKPTWLPAARQRPPARVRHGPSAEGIVSVALDHAAWPSVRATTCRRWFAVLKERPREVASESGASRPGPYT